MTIRRLFPKTPVLVAIAALLLSPASALADWTVYGAGALGISTGKGEVSGTIGPVSFSDSDRDSSPVISGAVGLEIPLDELMAWGLPYDLELPDWPFRTEIEFLGLRDLEYRTTVNAGTPPDIYLTSSSQWAMMINGFFDLPTTPLAKPLAWTFQTRKSSMKRILDPISFYVGPGVGMANVKVDAVTTAARQARSDDYKFAWQVGTGFGYRLTPFVHLDLGYRFFKADQVDPVLRDSVGDISDDEFVFTEHVNEFRFGVRVNVYSFTSPWERLE